MHDLPPREEEIFNATLDLNSPEERAAYLREACGGDESLRRRVEALLQAHEQAGTFLEHPPLSPTRTSDLAAETGLAAPVEKPGDRIGRYKLLEKIGEGGCGVVYMAEQTEPIHRRVALKVIKLGMDTHQVIARFEAERQALALMDHPNIAKVFDAGATDSGRPYFVMELVRGIKITDYCEQHRLSTRERLDLFIAVCHAVQHAHQKGIIHRDLKPSNILVASADGVPVPKVIDFGIAKATSQQPLTDKTLFTAFAQFMGTPAYMSPEQAELSALDIDTRSDIYSLGVLLYELLTGKLPFEPETLLRAGLDEMRRIIRETEPAKPSTRLTTALVAADVRRLKSPSSQTSPPTSQPKAGASFRRLLQEVKGDLDWIVMKCLEKDRRRRYETANALADDLQRHLNHEPVMAAAPSMGYRMGKFVRRHRQGVVTASALIVLLVAGIAASAWQAVRATRAENKALAEAVKSEQVASFLKDMLQGVRPSVALGRDTEIMRDILDKAGARIGKEVTNQPQIEAELRLVIGTAYLELGEHTQAEEHFVRALSLQRQLHGPEHPDVAHVLEGFAHLLEARGKWAEALGVCREALAMHRKWPDPENQYTPQLLNTLGVLLRKQGKLAEAEEQFRSALAMQKRLIVPECPEVAQSLNNIAEVLWERGNRAEGERLFREALAMRQKLLPLHHPAVVESLNNIAAILLEQGKQEEAEGISSNVLATAQQVFGPEHRMVASSLFNLAGIVILRGRAEEAEGPLRQALAIRRKVLDRNHPEIAESLNRLALVIEDLGKQAEAEALHREALAMRREHFGEDHATVAESLRGLAGVVAMQGRSAQAETLYREALATQKKVLGPEHREIAGTMHNLAMLLWQEGKHAEAEAMLRDTLAMQKNLFGPEHQDVALTLDSLSILLASQGQLTEAEATCRESLAIRRKLLGREHPAVVASLRNLAGVMIEQRKLDEAERTLREALAILEKAGGTHSPEAYTLRRHLARILQQQGKHVEAEALLRKAKEPTADR